MAIACLRFLTGCFPDFMWRISVRTDWPAFLLYLRPRDRRLEVLLPELPLLLELLLLLGMLVLL